MENLELVEYRVKGQDEVWEGVPVIVTCGFYVKRMTQLHKQAWAMGLSISRGNCGNEVRWNRVGGLQGNYAQDSKLFLVC